MAYGHWLKDYIGPHVEGGGGGSSDFSTATLTIDLVGVPSMARFNSIGFPVFAEAYNDELDDIHIPAMATNFIFDQTGGFSNTFTVPLYKGKAYIDNPNHYFFSTEGSITPLTIEEEDPEDPEQTIEVAYAYYLTGNARLYFGE